jgi:F-type H+-transporting ATPase subunit epsilon
MAGVKEELQVTIQTPEAVIWEGKAQSVSSQNSAGVFDILPDHANMITLIDQKPIVVVTSKGPQEFKFGRALISVEENKIHIYADIELKGEQIQ